MCVCFSAEPLEKTRSSLCLALPHPPLTSNPSHPPVHPCCQRMDPVTMTTGGCCHLPGSLCDCASSTGLWKSVEEAGSDGCQALYVTQVTAIDGRLLSSVLKPMSAQRYFKNITVIAVRCSTGKLWMGLCCLYQICNMISRLKSSPHETLSHLQKKLKCALESL